MKKYYSPKLIKRSKKENYKIWQCLAYSDIEGYTEYFQITDYNGNFIKNVVTFQLALKEVKNKI